MNSLRLVSCSDIHPNNTEGRLLSSSSNSSSNDNNKKHRLNGKLITQRKRWPSKISKPRRQRQRQLQPRQSKGRMHTMNNSFDMLITTEKTPRGNIMEHGHHLLVRPILTESILQVSLPLQLSKHHHQVPLLLLLRIQVEINMVDTIKHPQIKKQKRVASEKYRIFLHG
jgi:hypothetical protein